MSSAKAGANPARRKPQGSGGRIVRSGLVGPKARPGGVVEGDAVESPRRPGPGEAAADAAAGARVQMEGRGAARGNRRGAGERGATCRSRRAAAAAEKRRPGRDRVSVPKPPQVGEARSLRRAGERSLRNSANCPRIFGRRGPVGETRRGQHSGPSDCLPQTQVPAKSQDAV
jgi:hypothetical protein